MGNKTSLGKVAVVVFRVLHHDVPVCSTRTNPLLQDMAARGFDVFEVELRMIPGRHTGINASLAVMWNIGLFMAYQLTCIFLHGVSKCGRERQASKVQEMLLFGEGERL